MARCSICGSPSYSLWCLSRTCTELSRSQSMEVEGKTELESQQYHHLTLWSCSNYSSSSNLFLIAKTMTLNLNQLSIVYKVQTFVTAHWKAKTSLAYALRFQWPHGLLNSYGNETNSRAIVNMVGLLQKVLFNTVHFERHWENPQPPDFFFHKNYFQVNVFIVSKLLLLKFRYLYKEWYFLQSPLLCLLAYACILNYITLRFQRELVFTLSLIS